MNWRRYIILKRSILTFGIISLFILSALAPMTFGTDIESKENPTIENFDRHLYPENYDFDNQDEIPSFIEYQNYDVSTNHEGSKAKEIKQLEMTQPLDGPMDSPWPMYCHDARHTGRSPYSTADNIGFEEWRFGTIGFACFWIFFHLLHKNKDLIFMLFI